jgi:pimeloyl-ACP methyl ester carboxylesterase
LTSLVSLDKSVLNTLPLRENSDVYFIEQRGGALTGDELFCPELVFAPEVGQEFLNIEQVQKAASSCFDRMKKAGVDARDFGTAEFAQDAYELMRLAEPKTQFNIVSTSYGTRTLERLIQQYGSKHIKAVAIDGPLPLSISALNDANILEPLDEIIRICAESGLCSADNQPMPVGQARSGFIDSITELTTSPRYTKTGKKIEASDVFQFLLGQMSQGNLDNVVPMTIALSQQRVDDALGMFDFDLVKILVPNPMGLYYSAICSDESTTKPLMKGASWPTHIREAAAKGLNPITSAICSALPTSTVEAFTDKGFVFNKPALVTVGQFDPMTPASNFSKVQTRFQQAVKLEFPGLSHGLVESDLCVQKKIADFLNNPQAMPSTNCAP